MSQTSYDPTMVDNCIIYEKNFKDTLDWSFGMDVMAEIYHDFHKKYLLW